MGDENEDDVDRDLVGSINMTTPMNPPDLMGHLSDAQREEISKRQQNEQMGIATPIGMEDGGDDDLLDDINDMETTDEDEQDAATATQGGIGDMAMDENENEEEGTQEDFDE